MLTKEVFHDKLNDTLVGSGWQRLMRHEHATALVQGLLSAAPSLLFVEPDYDDELDYYDYAKLRLSFDLVDGRHVPKRQVASTVATLFPEYQVADCVDEGPDGTFVYIEHATVAN